MPTITTYQDDDWGDDFAVVGKDELKQLVETAKKANTSEAETESSGDSSTEQTTEPEAEPSRTAEEILADMDQATSKDDVYRLTAELNALSAPEPEAPKYQTMAPDELRAEIQKISDESQSSDEYFAKMRELGMVQQ